VASVTKHSLPPSSSLMWCGAASGLEPGGRYFYRVADSSAGADGPTKLAQAFTSGRTHSFKVATHSNRRTGADTHMHGCVLTLPAALTLVFEARGAVQGMCVRQWQQQNQQRGRHGSGSGSGATAVE
jgi:hypothetical protein